MNVWSIYYTIVWAKCACVPNFKIWSILTSATIGDNHICEFIILIWFAAFHQWLLVSYLLEIICEIWIMSVNKFHATSGRIMNSPHQSGVLLQNCETYQNSMHLWSVAERTGKLLRLSQQTNNTQFHGVLLSNALHTKLSLHSLNVTWHELYNGNGKW